MPAPTDLPLRSNLERRLQELRRESARRSLGAFARIYLHAHFSLPPSRMHSDVIGLLQRASVERDARIAIAAPRGHAKTTLVSLAYVLWSICLKSEPFIVLISNTGDQACDLLAAVKFELESNPLLLADFPEAAEPPQSKPAPERWRRAEIITRNGVRVFAIGA